jgi:hypothetical protein
MKYLSNINFKKYENEKFKDLFGSRQQVWNDTKNVNNKR